MSSFARRSHLVERAADVARAAMAADAPLARVLRPPLVPAEAIPAVVETVVRPIPYSQPAGPAGPEALAPITRALLRRAGLVGEAVPAREEIALVREQILRSVLTEAWTKI